MNEASRVAALLPENGKKGVAKVDREQYVKLRYEAD